MSQVEALSRQACADLNRARQASRVRQVESLMQRAAIPARYRDASLQGAVASQAGAYRAAQAYVERFADHRANGAGLLLVGDVGTGKTHLACAVANALLAEALPVMYCTVLEAVMLVKRAWRKDADLSEYEVYEQFAVPDLLILDEVGVQHGTEFEAMVLTSIVDARSRACLPTIAISNHEPQGVMAVLGERAFDRLLGCGGQVLEMRGRSLRQQWHG